MSPLSGTWALRVRTCECDGLGHVNNAVYLDYLQEATAEVWPTLGASSWAPRRLTLEYLAPARPAEDLEVLAWPAGWDEALPAAGYQVRGAGGRAILRGRIVWQGATAPLSDWGTGAPPGCLLPKDARPPGSLFPGRLFRWRHRVRHYELGLDGRVQAAHVLRWIEEAKFQACEQVGWSLARLRREGIVIVQIRHDAAFLAPLPVGVEVEVTSRVCEMGRVRGCWQHEVLSGGECIATDYAAGAFLDASGRPCAPPQAMLEALQANDF